MAQQDAEEAFLILVGSLVGNSDDKIENSGLIELAESVDLTKLHLSISIPEISFDGLHTSILASCSEETLNPFDQVYFAENLPTDPHPFRGFMNSVLRCSICGGHHGWKMDAFLDISLAIPTHRLSRSICLEDCLRSWSDAEIIGGASCDKCLIDNALLHLNTKTHQLQQGFPPIPSVQRQHLESATAEDIRVLSASEISLGSSTSLTDDVRRRCLKALNGQQAGVLMKRLSFARVPEVFCCHLRRVIPTVTGFRKDSTPVTFPLLLDLAPFCTPAVEGFCMDLPRTRIERYELAGLVQHLGDAYGGHYVAYARRPTPTGREWRFFNDSHSRPAPLQEVLAAEAYLLVYQRVPV